MEEVSFSIDGDIPSKKNSRSFVSTRYGGFTVPGAFYQKWHREVMKGVKGIRFGNIPFAKVEVLIVFYPSTKRRADLTNKAESIMDFLVDCGILTDDNWHVCSKLTLEFGAVDRKNPRAVVTLRL
jgi:hypothetical protein